MNKKKHRVLNSESKMLKKNYFHLIRITLYDIMEGVQYGVWWWCLNYKNEMCLIRKGGFLLQIKIKNKLKYFSK